MAAEDLIGDAHRCSYEEFDRRCASFAAGVDRRGDDRDHASAHDQRTASVVNERTRTRVSARLGNAQGAVVEEIFAAFVEAEYRTDCAAAGPGRALPRTAAQRRADAFVAMARASVGDGAGPHVVVNVVVDLATFERELLRDTALTAEPFDPCDYARRRCETLHGVPLAPSDAVAAMLVGSVRRILVDSASVVIDQGRARRFTRAARHALLLQHQRCAYAGCAVRGRDADGDHVVPYARGGGTNPANGSLLCGHHNRWKNQGYTVRRRPDGTWRTLRPDGTDLAEPP
ncbi:MAG: HNH endonuclease signature motif containing protein [Ilumatobacteraceae bacterium]